MSITLSFGATTIVLNPDLYWSDEHTWHPVEQIVSRSITGAQIISVGQRTGGRPITLKPREDNRAWMTYADLSLLKAWAAIAGLEMQLTLRGITRAVVWNHPDALDGLPVDHSRDVLDGDYFRITLKFLEI